MTEQQPEQLATIPTEDAGAQTPNGVGDLDIVRIFNEELQAYGEAPRAGVAFLAGWEIVDPTPEEAERLTDYDPSTHSAGEVTAYFEEASDGEVEAIKALESAEGGKQRKTVLSWERSGDSPAS